MAETTATQNRWHWRTMLAQTLAAMILFVSTALPAAAEFTAAQKEQLAEKIEAFEAAVRVSDVAEVVRVMPPAVYEFMAAGSGMSIDSFRDFAIEKISEVMDGIEVLKVEMDVVNVEYLMTPDGFDYALVPSSIEFSLPEVGAIEATSHTLALMDNDQWYLLRIDDPQQLLIITQVYPSFKNVELPRGSYKVLE